MEAKRITDALNTKSADDSGPVVTCGPEYSTVCPFNANNTLVLVLYRSYFALHSAVTGQFLRNLPLEIHAEACPRWDPNNPNLLYFFHGNQLKEYDVQADAIRIKRAFTEYQKIDTGGDREVGGEADISEDGHHLVIAGDDRAVFLYDLVADKKSPVFQTDGRFNALYCTPDNNILICWNADTARGIQIWRPYSVSGPREVAPILSHQDVGRDSDGSEILIWMNSPDGSVNNNGIDKIRLGDGARTLLHPFGWDKDDVASSLIFHIACPKSHPNYCIVETWDKQNPNSTKPYANAILRLWMDGDIEEIVKHHSFAKTYEGQPKTAVSRDGIKLLFASNSGITNPESYSDAYLLDLARAAADPPRPAPVSVPAPAPAPVSSSDPLAGWRKVDFSSIEGRETQMHFKVVNGELVFTGMWEKG